jgi:hypothetical protein
MYTLTIPRLTNRFVLMMIAYGVVLLAWLTPEGNAIWLVSLLGTILAWAGLWSVVRSRWGNCRLSPRLWIPGSLVFGGVAGFSSALATIWLMLMKNVQHSHSFLDFPSEVVVGILARSPVWALAGFLVGGAFVLARLALVGLSRQIR